MLSNLEKAFRETTSFAPSTVLKAFSRACDSRMSSLSVLKRSWAGLGEILPPPLFEKTYHGSTGCRRAFSEIGGRTRKWGTRLHAAQCALKTSNRDKRKHVLTFKLRVGDQGCEKYNSCRVGTGTNLGILELSISIDFKQ